jgi:DNA primase
VDFGLPDEFKPVWKDGKWSRPVYLKERGIKRETAKAWGMGYCTSGRFASRLVIPVICPAGKSFTARSMDGAEPRYLNPKGADHRRLFCGWNMVKPKGQVVLVEGPLDAVRMWQHGFPALSMMGKVLHFEQFAMLASTYPPDTEIMVMTDPEEVEAPYKIGSRLLVRYERVYIAKLPLGVDPGVSTREQANKALDSATRYRGEKGRALPGILAKAKERLAKIYQ